MNSSTPDKSTGINAMKLNRTFGFTIALIVAAGLHFGAGRCQADPTAVGVPKGSPVFNVEMPDGWKAKDALTGISPELWSADNGINVSFQKVGAFADDEAGKTRVDNEAKMTALGAKDIKCTEPPAVAAAEVAGNKSYQTTYTYGTGDEAYMVQVNAFSLDGKEYYLAQFRGPVAKVQAGSASIAGLLESIAAEK